MRYTPLSPDFYYSNRKQLFQLMKSGSVAVFLSNDVSPTNADASYPYRQNNDLFYFTGIEQEETYLVMRKGLNGEEKSILFITKPDKLTTTWAGDKISKKKVLSISEISDIKWNTVYEKSLRKEMSSINTLYLSGNPATANQIVKTPAERLESWCQIEFPAVKIISKPFHQLRLIKGSEELNRIQAACNITTQGFTHVLGVIKPGMKEFEIEAELSRDYLRMGSSGFAYQPIIASGVNACILHYTFNNKTCKNGDLVLMDVGANYGMYVADLTRTVPISGRYSKRQKAVYNSVLKVQKFAFSILKPGLEMSEYNNAIREIMEAELIKLKLLSKSEIRKQNARMPAYRKYFMHGTSHQLGLDVHDVGGKLFDHFKENMVITVEPGIYIKEEQLGIRIENDVALTKNGILDFMSHTPVETEEIEDLMNA